MVQWSGILRCQECGSSSWPWTRYDFPPGATDAADAAPKCPPWDQYNRAASALLRSEEHQIPTAAVEEGRRGPGTQAQHQGSLTCMAQHINSQRGAPVDPQHAEHAEGLELEESL